MTDTEYLDYLQLRRKACDLAVNQSTSLSAGIAYIVGGLAFIAGVFGGLGGSDWGWPVAILGLFGVLCASAIGSLLSIEKLLAHSQKIAVEEALRTMLERHTDA